MNQEINTIIDRFQLEKHPEGGYFRETYRSEGIIQNEALPSFIEGNRNYCTGIYFLLTSANFSAFHKINQDEMWHFYKGSALKIHVISPQGTYNSVIVGNNLAQNENPQFVVPAHHWFAAEVIDSNSYSFVGCTVSPGFDFKDFVLAKEENLINQFPQHREVISKFTIV